LGDLIQLRKSFISPTAEYRSAPFWAWNDKLEKEEISWQIKEMKKQGVGGFFMHSRDGLETPYMGEEWISNVQEAVKVASEQGMIAWIYDEDRWPSGSAGGLIPAKGDAYRAKGLTIDIISGELSGDETVIALFKAVIDGMAIFSCERLEYNPGKVYRAHSGEVLLAFRIEVAEAVEWFNDESPHDNLNPDSVKEFIEVTYEGYKKAVGDQFGTTIAGVFTDEPSIADRHCKFTEGRGWLPWTYSFPEYFTLHRGYDVFNMLPYIFFNGDPSSVARHDYWRTISDMFADSYTKQLGQWCEDNNLAFTGHYLWENNLGVATRVCGAIMPNYRYQHVPGIDMLMEQVDETITVKQCTSVANQYGKKRVITETYGCVGWEFTFEGQKWLGDFQYVQGVNLRSQHLALYSLKGCRKRDYPPVFNYNTSWWKYNHIVEDYFARIAAVMTEGNVIRDILVLHPSSTAWVMLGANPYGIPDRNRDRDIPGINRFGDQFNQFIRYLLGMHYDFDLGDETIIGETGKVENGKFTVNLATYEVVIIPSIQTMLRSTMELLLEFMDAGGKVIAIEPLAELIEGRPTAELKRLHQHVNMVVVKKPADTVQELEKLIPRRVSLLNKYLVEAPEMLYMLTEMDEGWALFVVNNDRYQTLDIQVTIDCMGSVEEWNLMNGDISEIEVAVQEGRVVIDAKFGPAGSKLYYIVKGKAPRNKLPVTMSGHTQLEAFARPTYASLGPVCGFTRTMPNVLVLDKCQYRLDEESWSEELDVWQAQRIVRDRLEMRQVYYNGSTQRYKWIYEPHPRDGTPLELKFTFRISELPVSDVFLVLESAELFHIRLNNCEIPVVPQGWFMDKAFTKIKLTNLKLGMNELIVSCDYLNRMELEDCYVIGDFGVDASRAIVAEPKQLHFGDWCLQGYYHYSGSMIYHFEVDFELQKDQLALMELGEYSAVTIDIRVNDMPAGHVPWRDAGKLDITPLLVNGSNRVDIEVVGSPRNMFGPFHQARGKAMSTGWESFRTEGVEYTPDYIVHAYGLFEQIKIFSGHGE
jgi:hypothetical protein